MVVKDHAFSFEELALVSATSARAEADLPLRVDDALPGDVLRAICHSSSHPTGAEGQVGLRVHPGRRGQKASYATIGGDFPGRNLADKSPDLVIELIALGGRNITLSGVNG
jgi:hypothetical protein